MLLNLFQQYIMKIIHHTHVEFITGMQTALTLKIDQFNSPH